MVNDDVMPSDPTPAIGAEANTPAGWYTEPETSWLRYWDGATWTEQRRSVPKRESTSTPRNPNMPPSCRSPSPERARAPARPSGPGRRVRLRSLCLAIVMIGVFAAGYLRAHTAEFKLECAYAKSGVVKQSFPDNVLCAVFWQ